MTRRVQTQPRQEGLEAMAEMNEAIRTVIERYSPDGSLDGLSYHVLVDLNTIVRTCAGDFEREMVKRYTQDDGLTA